jgi:hypothetical protein
MPCLSGSPSRSNSKHPKAVGRMLEASMQLLNDSNSCSGAAMGWKQTSSKTDQADQAPLPLPFPGNADMQPPLGSY